MDGLPAYSDEAYADPVAGRRLSIQPQGCPGDEHGQRQGGAGSDGRVAQEFASCESL